MHAAAPCVLTYSRCLTAPPPLTLHAATALQAAGGGGPGMMSQESAAPQLTCHELLLDEEVRLLGEDDLQDGAILDKGLLDEGLLDEDELVQNSLIGVAVLEEGLLDEDRLDEILQVSGAILDPDGFGAGMAFRPPGPATAPPAMGAFPGRIMAREGEHDASCVITIMTDPKATCNKAPGPPRPQPLSHDHGRYPGGPRPAPTVMMDPAPPRCSSGSNSSQPSTVEATTPLPFLPGPLLLGEAPSFREAGHLDLLSLLLAGAPDVVGPYEPERGDGQQDELLAMVDSWLA